MVNLYLLIFNLLFLSDNSVQAKNLVSFINQRTELLLIFVILGFIFFVLLFIFIHHVTSLKRENIFRLYLNIENMWNSAPMLEARQKASMFVTDDLLHSKDTADKEAVHFARVIVDFFNHIGLQVYQEIIDFGHIYNLLGQEILDYWDKKNYKHLVHYEKHKNYPTDINPWVGFEYLADICFQQKEYLRGALWVPASFPPMNYQRVEEKISKPQEKKSNVALNWYLIVFSILAFISLVIFLWSYLLYNGYV